MGFACCWTQARTSKKLLPKLDMINISFTSQSSKCTSHNETIRSCLVVMKEHVSHGVRASFDVGSGICSLPAFALAKIGYSRVVGVGTDILSLDAALLNVDLNNQKFTFEKKTSQA
jgi:ribosomal protein L11 methylase PrmA